MIERILRPPVRIGSRIVTTLDEAAYELRQFAVQRGDNDAWRLSHALRDIADDTALQSLEGRLRAWSLITNAHRPE